MTGVTVTTTVAEAEAPTLSVTVKVTSSVPFQFSGAEKKAVFVAASTRTATFAPAVAAHEKSVSSTSVT